MSSDEHFNKVMHQQLSTRKSDLPYWVEMIRDLVDGMDYTYSRIAKRIGVVPSTIQKLATIPGRKPRHRVFHDLLCLYYKVFYSECRLPQAEQYLKLKEQHALLQQSKERQKK